METTTDLFPVLGFCDCLTAHLDARLQEPTDQVCHIQAQEMSHLVGGKNKNHIIIIKTLNKVLMVIDKSYTNMVN